MYDKRLPNDCQAARTRVVGAPNPDVAHVHSGFCAPRHRWLIRSVR